MHSPNNECQHTTHKFVVVTDVNEAPLLSLMPSYYLVDCLEGFIVPMSDSSPLGLSGNVELFSNNLPAVHIALLTRTVKRSAHHHYQYLFWGLLIGRSILSAFGVGAGAKASAIATTSVIFKPDNKKAAIAATLG